MLRTNFAVYGVFGLVLVLMCTVIVGGIHLRATQNQLSWYKSRNEELETAYAQSVKAHAAQIALLKQSETNWREIAKFQDKRTGATFLKSLSPSN